MSRVLLVSTNRMVQPYPVFPLGMAVVAAALAARGHQVRQVDLLAGGGEELLDLEMAAFDPAVVGISIRNLDDVDSLGPGEFAPDGDRQVVERIRRLTGAPVVLGGAGFSLMPEGVLALVGADYGVVGEGERAFPDLVEALEQGRSVPPLVRADRSLAGPEIPLPAVDSGLVPFYRRESGMLNLQSKRGCPHRCNYCSYPSLEGNLFRGRDPDQVAGEAIDLRRRHGIDCLFFTDAVFNDAQGHYLRVAEALIRHDAGIRWAAFFRPQGLTRAILALLKESGLYALEIGTDAASDVTLEGLDKGFTMDDVIETDRAVRDENLPAAHYVIFGGPGETLATVRQGLENLSRLESSVVFAFLGIRIIPGTPLQRLAVEDGTIAPDEDLTRPRYYLAPGLDSGEVAAMIQDSFRGNRLRIFPPSEGHLRARVMYQLGFRGLLWDHLVAPGRDSRRGPRHHAKP